MSRTSGNLEDPDPVRTAWLCGNIVPSNKDVVHNPFIQGGSPRNSPAPTIQNTHTARFLPPYAPLTNNTGSEFGHGLYRFEKSSFHPSERGINIRRTFLFLFFRRSGPKILQRYSRRGGPGTRPGAAHRARNLIGSLGCSAASQSMQLQLKSGIPRDSESSQ